MSAALFLAVATAVGCGQAAVAHARQIEVVLPEKYSGRNIVFWTGGFELAGCLTITRDGRWPIVASADVGRTFTHVPSAQYIRRSLGMSIGVGFVP